MLHGEALADIADRLSLSFANVSKRSRTRAKRKGHYWAPFSWSDRQRLVTSGWCQCGQICGDQPLSGFRNEGGIQCRAHHSEVPQEAT